MKVQTVRFSNALFNFLFPMMKAKSLIELASANLLFDQYKSGSSIRRFSCILIIYLTTIMTGFKVPVLIHLRPLRSNSLGDLGYLLFECLSLAFIEMFTIRVWLFFFIRRHQSPEQIEFVQLLDQLDQKSHDRLLYWAKFVSNELTLAALAFIIITMTVEAYNSMNICNLILTAFYLILYSYGCTVTPHDVVILYTYALAAFKVVKDQMEQLEMSLNEYPQFTNPMFQIVSSYFKLINSVRQLNSLSKILMLTSHLLGVPLGSLLIYLALTPATNLLLIFFKITILSAGFVYTIRGYLLIAIFSRADTHSKKIFSRIYSIVVREKHRSLIHVWWLKFILEDISSRENHMAIRTFNSAIDQLHAISRIATTVCILILLFLLKGTS